jgi:hypothetical protein
MDTKFNSFKQELAVSVSQSVKVGVRQGVHGALKGHRHETTKIVTAQHDVAKPVVVQAPSKDYEPILRDLYTVATRTETKVDTLVGRPQVVAAPAPKTHAGTLLVLPAGTLTGRK